jgi:hypothetical protein
MKAAGNRHRTMAEKLSVPGRIKKCLYEIPVDFAAALAPGRSG